MIGGLIVDKPAGPTSHDIINRVRRAAGTRRVGHIGTLDPFATGVLVICVGPATRLVQFLTGLHKRYTATVRLGFATDTQDRTGKQVGPTTASNGLSRDDIEAALQKLRGTRLQVPPMFSAKKVGGTRLYQAARAGLEIERKGVEITVDRLEIVGEPVAADDGTIEFSMDVHCSSGTYVRTLAHELGEALGVGGHLTGLRRDAVGHFELVRAHSPDELDDLASGSRLNEVLLSPSDLLLHLPSIRVESEGLRRIRNGQSIDVAIEDLPDSTSLIRLCDAGGHLAAVGQVSERSARPIVVLASDRL